MRIDKETLRKIAHLARLEFEEDSEDHMIKDLTGILDWVDQLKEVDTKGVAPLTNMSHEVNMLREDEVGEPLEHERGLKNAPQRDENFFKVPKVIE